MLKKALLAALAVACTLTIAGCSCEHVWKDATCTTPKTCESCGETEGEPIAHSFVTATCTEPKTCKDCGFTEGAPAGHTWIEATCATPKTCETCNTAEGDLGEHVWLDATYSTPQTCELCNATEGDVLVRTDYSTDAFYDSNACFEITNQLIGIMPEGMDFTASYAEMSDFSWSIYLDAPVGTKEAYMQDTEAWRQLKNDLIGLSANAQESLAKDGFLIDFKIYVFDAPDPNTSPSLQKDKIMLEMKNGDVISDYLAGVAPAVPFLESTAYTGVRDLIMNSYADYNPRFELNNNTFYVFFTAPDGTDLALSNPSDQAKENWKTTTESLAEMSYIASVLFAGDGYDTLCAIMYVSDLNPEEALFCVIGGQVIYNCLT